jgi:hypothetical protein
MTFIVASSRGDLGDSDFIEVRNDRAPRQDDHRTFPSASA